MKREFFTAPNLLSISRAFLAIPFVLVMLVPDPPLRVWGAVIIVLAMLTDKFDGVLARRYGQQTEWGKILDPLADKIGVATVALVLLWLGDIPLWFVGALLLRDFLIFGGGMVVKATRGVVLASNQYGKWTVGIVAVTLLLALLGVLPEIRWALLGASAAGLLLSFIMYGARFLEVMNTPRQ
jgi:CDP-diacylglycerol--glycerol-3-phosphate 3-phosphatidyltransferase